MLSNQSGRKTYIYFPLIFRILQKSQATRARSHSRPSAHAYGAPDEELLPPQEFHRTAISTKFKTATAPTLRSSPPHPSLRRIQTDVAVLPPRPTNGSPAKRKMMKADYAFEAESDSELTIVPGDRISVIEEVDSGWYVGEIIDGPSEGMQGLFPATYCSVIDDPRRISTKSSPARDSTRSSPVRESPGIFDDVPTTTATRKPGYVRNVSSSPAVPVLGKKKPPPPPAPRGSKPQFASASGPAASAESACRECGCKEFQLNVFKRDNSCNNCFHVHNS